jgi:hypothetical protein
LSTINTDPTAFVPFALPARPEDPPEETRMRGGPHPPALVAPLSSGVIERSAECYEDHRARDCR